MYYTQKDIKKSHIRIMNLKYQLQHGMENLTDLMDQILFKIFKFVLVYLKKTWRKDYYSFNKNICKQHRKKNHV